jgi:thiol-disulfide isomerase/thioredoxin
MKTYSMRSNLKPVIFFFFLFILAPSTLFSQNVTVKGKVLKGAEGKTIALYAYSDQLTYTFTKIASAKIDSTGKFNFSFKTDKIIFAYLKIDFNQAPIYIEPWKTYDMVITCADCGAADDHQNPYLYPKQLDVVLSGKDSSEINSLIERFNAMYENFVWKNYALLVKQRNKMKIDSFELSLNKQFGIYKNDYVSSLIKYRCGQLEEMGQIISAKNIAKKYFWKQPVLYDNTGYMEFFNEFFNNYVPAESHGITMDDLDRTINTERSFPALLDSLGKDSVLRNEVIRELVAMKTISTLYYVKGFDKSSILEMFNYVIDNSKFPQHKIIAQNYIKYLTKLTVGTAAPDFTLKDFTGLSYSLSEFNKDKYVYLFFWTTWSATSLSEMDLLSKLKEKYGTKVEFVGICADKEFMTYYYFMQKNKKYDFTTLHFGNNQDLLENYEVKAYPAFVLIGPDGKILQYPAEPPSGALNELFYDLTKIK